MVVPWRLMETFSYMETCTFATAALPLVDPWAEIGAKQPENSQEIWHLTHPVYRLYIYIWSPGLPFLILEGGDAIEIFTTK